MLACQRWMISLLCGLLLLMYLAFVVYLAFENNPWSVIGELAYELQFN